jgi:UDPglucose 6-dehydrogenase
MKLECGSMSSKSISIVGMGYVGLCTGIGFANKDFCVIAADKDSKKVTLINKGIPTFHEPKLEELLQEAIKNGNLKCISDTEKAVKNTDITFITVGTPSNSDGSINLTQINDSASEIGNALNIKDDYHLVVVKSTVVPGTTENTIKPILEKQSHKVCGADFGLCMNPEFLQEGSAVHDAQHPDRIIIGENDQKSGDILQALYSEVHHEESIPIIRTNLPTAELIKYANNSFLATKISYINTIANICEKISGADISIVAQCIGLDKRINPQFLKAGLGYGGSCFPKDVKALIAFSSKLGYRPNLLQATHEVNQKQANYAVAKAKSKLKDLKDKKVAILGLAFKPDTDDMREARSILIINQLLTESAIITVYDPVAISNAKSIFGNRINYASSAINCLKGADCCILVTEWNEFKNLKPEDFNRNMRQSILIDGRRIYNPIEYRKELNFQAIGLGET